MAFAKTDLFDPKLNSTAVLIQSPCSPCEIGNFKIPCGNQGLYDRGYLR